MLSDEYRYKILRLLEENPQLSQRDLADRLGVSLGKANYCLQALIRLGLIKARNFRNNQNRTAYLYVLTPRGLLAKARSATRFLRLKITEYETLQREIERLRREVSESADRRVAE
jgi:EPS-associated MarR family transcriptional regulator